MPLNKDFLPLLEAIKYVFEEPGGVFMVSAITMDNGLAEQLTIAPPSSLKLFRNAENKSELLNFGLVGNSHLKRKITPDALKWLRDNGWADPQEPFNPHHSLTGRADLTLDQLLELALESWVVAYQVSPNTPLTLHLSLEQQEHIAANFLDLDRSTYAYSIPGFQPNIELLPQPEKKKRVPKKDVREPEKQNAIEKKPEPTKQDSKKTSATKSQPSLGAGSTATLKIVVSGQKVDVTGLVLSIEGEKARFEVKGSPYVPDQVYVIPVAKLKFH